MASDRLHTIVDLAMQINAKYKKKLIEECACVSIYPSEYTVIFRELPTYTTVNFAKPNDWIYDPDLTLVEGLMRRILEDSNG